MSNITQNIVYLYLVENEVLKMVFKLSSGTVINQDITLEKNCYDSIREALVAGQSPKQEHLELISNALIETHGIFPCLIIERKVARY